MESLKKMTDKFLHVDDDKFIKEKLDKYRKCLIPFLNKKNSHANIKSWNVIIDPFLHKYIHFIGSVYQSSIESKSSSLSKDTETKEIIIHPPISSLDFNTIIKDQDFQKQITNIAKVFLGSNRKINVILPDTISNNQRINFRQSFLIRLSRAVIFTLVKLKITHTVLTDASFRSIKKSIMFSFLSMFRILVIPSYLVFLSSSTRTLFKENKKFLDKASRQEINIRKDDDFDKLVEYFLPFFLPVNFLEFFESNLKEIRSFTKIPRIGSSVGILLSDSYKILVALFRQSKKPIIGIQHGGNYFIYRDEPLDIIFELECSTHYFSWAKKRYTTQISPPHLGRLNRNSTISDSIVFFSNGGHLDVFHEIHKKGIERTILENKNYFDNQAKFLMEINSLTKNKMIYRPYPDKKSLSNRVAEKLRKNNIFIDKSNDSFFGMQKARLLIIDYMSTTWLEAIYYDIPFIIICKNGFESRYSDKILTSIKVLKENGVLHKDFKSAIKFITKLLLDNSIDLWWNNEYLMTHITFLRRNYVRNDITTKDFIESIKSI